MKRLQDENRKLASSLAAANERDSAFSEDGEKENFCRENKKNLLKYHTLLLAFQLYFEDPFSNASYFARLVLFIINISQTRYKQKKRVNYNCGSS